MGLHSAELTGVLLAGGKSRRMGRDKRFVELDGHTLLDRTLSVYERLFSEILIIVAEPVLQLSGSSYRIVTDLIPDRGSLGGLYTGLFYATHQRAFVAACDMPFLNADVIKRMTELDHKADVVMVRLANGLQPMHAIYSKACLPLLKKMIDAEALKIQTLVHTPELLIRLVTEKDLRDVDPQLLSFVNVNSPADLEFARKLVRQQRGMAGGEQ